MNTEQVLERINRKEAVIGVVGLGYVGLPLAVEKAKAGYRVIGFDIQPKRVEMVNRGINYIGDVVDEELADLVATGQLCATADYSDIARVDAVSICVPTPLDRYQQPDTSYVEGSAREIAKRLHPGMLVVLESTTYPGTTEEVVLPILEESGLKVGRDFYLAFSPERVDPGNKIYNTKNTPKVVGGITGDCTRTAAALYRNVLEGEVFEVSGPAVAEMEKILENTFRNLNIALANEMSILCNKMGIDYWEVVEAAKTKPYGFMAFYPGPGLGGHCIPIDPYYLTWKAREYKYHTRLIELAGEINNYMPDFVVERIMKMLSRHGKPLKGSKVLLLGIAYKRDIDDMRESPAIEILRQLVKQGADVQVNDPHIPSFRLDGRVYESKPLTAGLLEEADLTVITTDHSAYDYPLIGEKARLIFDTRNGLKDVQQIRGDYEKI
ncbi:nucleotide sugar dehydrogenase [Kroppenstedtia eburnea]|uniref:UDP-N-acetyl-D-glucosamine dehydrogenase n=1 Tax=Kroppenstedtia eburnea TaxID=714067 RepID=A0A1N7JPM6_9BACL|nr:nucleotide sugar dehydrogenase [Kroppenstedtia eburnea]EGK10694.1 UDP-glucose/GDP-mannose dehydrogenase [Desmospora sp. 8437]QKI83483.1 nucleotide sugar dehydrogenase [Kroppenstedtia eburnea]SIS51265.1 UDP-N-acetyl-D-glucosamine dehydrogenase [Kroppenstedtia eburnea]